jgi:peptidoglycan/xylan/chitin deacetylase (PgdA/CDA1 family)
VIRSLKRSSLAVSKHLGLTRLVSESGWRRQRLMILCYHGVALADEHLWKSHLYVSQAHLERRLALLRRNRCSVLSLDDAITRLYHNDLPDRAVVITFDDGYHDFMAQAWPLLSAAGYPATVYLTTARVDHNWPIANLFLSYVVWQTKCRELDVTGLDGLTGRRPLATPEDRRRMTDRIQRMFQGLDGGSKDAIVRTVTLRLGLDYDALLASRILTLMRPADVAVLAKAGVDFQLHTHLHRTPDDPELFIRDVAHNRTRLEALTGARPSHLCYPSGLYRMSYLNALEREGIVSATTCDPGLASRDSNPLLLPRFVDTTMTSEIEFEGWITGVASCLPRRTVRGHPSLH